ncbi:LCP family protein [Peptoniphilaceae bacterium SGI.131]
MKERNFQDTQTLKKPNKKSKIKILNFMYIIGFLLFLYVIFVLFSKNILPLKYRAVYVGVVGFLMLLIARALYKKKGSKAVRAIAGILLVMIMAINAYGVHFVNAGLSIFGQLNLAKNVEYSLIVLRNSPYASISDINGKTVVSAEDKDTKNVSKYLDTIKKDNSVEINISKVNNVIAAADDLVNEKHEIMLLNESFRQTILEKYPKFNNATRVLSSTKIKLEDVTKIESKETLDSESFNIYVSGIDTYGDIETVSRSDVNLVLTINPRTNKILITSIPRDTYVKIAGGGNDEFDKLTHAGIYGVESSIKTLENFLGITINYYARVNFTSTMALVDVLGGIEIDNPEEFVVNEEKTYSYKKGLITLNGEEALRFVRERYRLADGDLARGRNQERVLAAMIKKAISPSILLNYGRVLSVVKSSVDTNISDSKITELINNQLSTGKDWDIDSQGITGYPRYDLPSYAMPGYQLFVLEPDEESVNKAIEAINKYANENPN